MVGATEKVINVSCTVILLEGYTLTPIKAKIQEAIEGYLLEMRKVWENGSLIVRISQIENRILSIEGVLDVLNTKINGSTENLPLNVEEIPVIGKVEVS